MRDLVVLGSGRSGTSMVAGTLSASGWWVGDDPYPGRAANAKGFFETAEINGVNEELLARMLPADAQFEQGQRWLAVPPAGARPEADERLRERIEKLVARRPFAFKDPRMCFTLPAWEPHLPADTGRVCVFRDPLATAASIVKECADAPYLASLVMDETRALQIWQAMYARVLEQAKRGDWHFVHFDQMLTQDGLARLEQFCGAPLDRRFPEASLRHAPEREAPAGELRDLYRELCARASFEPRSSVHVAATVPEARAPELSVILCTYQRLPILQRSIASFEAQDAAAGSFELVVVDDGCSDGSAEWLDGHAFRVPARVLHQKNGGLSSARNAGIAVARGRILLFVNDDTLAFPDLVREHLRAHAELAAAGAEACVLGTFEQPTAHLSSALMRHLESSGEVFRYHDMRGGEFYDHNRFWTCNVSVPAARVRTAGNFDERFVRYGCEDIDLGLRLERLGLRVLFHAGARAHHDHLLDAAALRRRQGNCSASFVHYFAKHPSELDHPDWAWLEGRSAASMRAELVQRSERQRHLEAAFESVARVDLPSLEALGGANASTARELVAEVGRLLAELNALWWQAGLAQGLDEVGCASFDELRAREPETRFGGWRVGTQELHARVHAMRVGAEAAAGETQIATLRAIGLAAALERAGSESLAREAQQDLAVLRHAAGDVRTARVLLEDLLARDPRNALARENLDAIVATPAAALPSETQPGALARRANLLRARVLCIGPGAQREALLAAGARSVQLCSTADELAELAVPDASFDVVLAGPPRTARGLDALARALRSGGRWVCTFARTAGLPEGATLLLDEDELGWYARRAGLSGGVPEPAGALDLAAAGFDVVPAPGATALQPGLMRELERRCRPLAALARSGGEFLLVRRGRRLVIGMATSNASEA